MSKENSKPLIPARREQRQRDWHYPVSVDNSHLLEFLGFKRHMQELFGNGIEVSVTFDSPHCVIKTNDVKKFDDSAVATFLSNVSTKKVPLDDNLCYQLIFSEWPHPNETFYESIKANNENLFKNDITFYISKSADGVYTVNVFSKSSKRANDVLKVITDNLIITKATVELNEECWEKLKELNFEKRLSYRETSPKEMKIFCSNTTLLEWQDYVTRHVGNNEKKLILSTNVLRFMNDKGTSMLSDIKKQYSVDADITESYFKLKGTYANIEKAENHLRLKLKQLKQEVSLKIPKHCFESRVEDINKEMNANSCVWSVLSESLPENRLQNCKYIASWVEPLRNLKVTVITGDPWYINVDLLIVLTNLSLFNGKILAPESFITQIRPIVEKGLKQKHRTHFEMLTCTEDCQASNTVVFVTASNNSSAIDNHLDIKPKVKELLGFISKKKKIKNIGIHIGLEQKADVVIRPIIEAAKESNDGNSNHIEELFICCQVPDKLQVLHKVDGCFSQMRGSLRRVYCSNEDIFQDAGSKIETRIELGCLHKVEACVIVNTTGSVLKLSEGGVSSAILKKAGQSLSDECKKKYPDGLANGKIAQTGAHNMKNCKRIYHIALPDFDINNFQQDVKQWVIKCLSQAERDDCGSIAFPALGVGKKRYPRRETAAAMFGAVEEFGSEVLHPSNLKTVKFVLFPSDILTTEAFQIEEWRRSEKCCADLGPMKPFIKYEYNAFEYPTGPQNPSIRVTTLEDFWIPPPHAVEVFFSNDVICRKRALDDPVSWNDQWFIRNGHTNKDIEETLTEMLREMIKMQDRMTEIVIYTNASDSRSEFGEEHKAKSICSFFAKKTPSFLKEVVIIVTDETSIKNMPNWINSGKNAVAAMTMKYLSKRTHAIEVIGKTTACANAGVAVLQKLLAEIDIEKKASLKQMLSARITAKEDIQQAVEVKEDMNLMDNDSMESMVTTEINQGIVEYMNASDWLGWKTKIQKAFIVEVSDVSGNMASVSGDFDRLMKLEQYLENDFPNDPPPISD